MELLEGRQAVFAALSARKRRFDVILLKHGIHEETVAEILSLASELSVPIKHIDARELDSMAHGSSHGGVLALATPKPRTTPDELREILCNSESPPLLLLIEGVDDARNLGFTIRSAEAFGAHAVLIKKHLWDFDSVEVARPSSGAYERLPLVQIDDTSLLMQLQREGIKLLGCIANARQTIHSAQLSKPTILAIGGEKRGLSGAVRSICNELVTIPIAKDPSSLSLSHAAAVVLAEAMRQRAL